MPMKVTEHMLDMASGDASLHEIKIAEAVGKINVCCNLFNSAYNISELSEEAIPYIQEAAAEKNIPTDKKGAVNTAIEAVLRELSAFYDLMIATAKRVKAAAEKDMKSLSVVGKKYGINMNYDKFMEGFLDPLCDAIDRAGSKGELDNRKFIKGKYAIRMTENYAKGMAKLVAGYNLRIDNAFENKVVSAIVKKQYSGDVIRDLRDVESNLSTGGKLLRFDKVVSSNVHYTSTIRSKDVRSFGMAVYATIQISDAVIRSLNGNTKKRVMSDIKRITFDSASKANRVTRSCESINDGIKEWSTNLNDLTNNMTKAFNDSAYNLTDAFR